MYFRFFHRKIMNWLEIFNLNQIMFSIWDYHGFSILLPLSSTHSTWRLRLWTFDEFYCRNVLNLENVSITSDSTVSDQIQGNQIERVTSKFKLYLETVKSIKLTRLPTNGTTLEYKYSIIFPLFTCLLNLTELDLSYFPFIYKESENKTIEQEWFRTVHPREHHV